MMEAFAEISNQEIEVVAVGDRKATLLEDPINKRPRRSIRFDLFDRTNSSCE